MIKTMLESVRLNLKGASSPPEGSGTQHLFLLINIKLPFFI